MNEAIIFICTNYNKYSIAALVGAIESHEQASVLLDKNVSLYFIEFKKDAAQTIDQIKDIAKNHEQLLICLSFATANILEVNEFIKPLKELAGKFSNMLIIAGGPHASGNPFGTLSMGIDIVVIGEGEETFPELIDIIIKKSNWKEINGIAYLESGRPIKTPKRKPIDLNRFAPFSIKKGRLSPIEISRGCPHACKFCQTSYLFGTRMRHRKIDEIIRYVKLSKSQGTRDFRFISPNALAYGSEDGINVNLEAIEELLSRVSKITGKEHLFFGSFPSEVRPESVSKEALGLIKKYTATKQLVIGAQTGSQRMLDMLNRKHSVDDVKNAVRLILDAEISVSVDFIFGLPGETNKDKAKSIMLIDELVAMGAKIHSHTFIPLPGTPLANEKAGEIDDELAIYLSRLANKGKQFGQWQKQQKIAKQITIIKN